MNKKQELTNKLLLMTGIERYDYVKKHCVSLNDIYGEYDNEGFHILYGSHYRDDEDYDIMTAED